MRIINYFHGTKIDWIQKKNIVKTEIVKVLITQNIRVYAGPLVGYQTSHKLFGTNKTTNTDRK